MLNNFKQKPPFHINGRPEESLSQQIKSNLYHSIAQEIKQNMKFFHFKKKRSLKVVYFNSIMNIRNEELI